MENIPLGTIERLFPPKPDTWVATSGLWKEPREVVIYCGVLNECK